MTRIVYFTAVVLSLFLLYAYVEKTFLLPERRKAVPVERGPVPYQHPQ